MGPFQNALSKLGEGLDYLTTLTGVVPGLKRGGKSQLALAAQPTTTKRRGRPVGSTNSKRTPKAAATTAKSGAPQATRVRRKANGELTMSQKIASVMGRKAMNNATILAALEAKGWATGKSPASNIAQVFTNDKKAKSPIFERVERGIYKVRRAEETETASGKAEGVASTKNTEATASVAGDPPSNDSDEEAQLAELGIGSVPPAPNPFA